VVAEPGVADSGVEALGVAAILRYVVDFLAAEEGAVGFPFPSIASAENEGAFAGADPDFERTDLRHEDSMQHFRAAVL
jgi:hypothetical protein